MHAPESGRGLPGDGLPSEPEPGGIRASPSPRSRPASSRWNPSSGQRCSCAAGTAWTLPTRAGLPATPNAIGALDAGASLLTELRRGGTGSSCSGGAGRQHGRPAGPASSAMRATSRTYGWSSGPGTLRRSSNLPSGGRSTSAWSASCDTLDIEALPLCEDELVLVAAGSHRFGDRTTVCP